MSLKEGWYGNDTRGKVPKGRIKKVEEYPELLLPQAPSRVDTRHCGYNRMPKWDYVCARVEERLRFNPSKDRENSLAEAYARQDRNGRGLCTIVMPRDH
jgi:hypothetical protein